MHHIVQRGHCINCSAPVGPGAYCDACRDQLVAQHRRWAARRPGYRQGEPSERTYDRNPRIIGGLDLPGVSYSQHTPTYDSRLAAGFWSLTVQDEH